jgi:hypothetical protein
MISAVRKVRVEECHFECRAVDGDEIQRQYSSSGIYVGMILIDVEMATVVILSWNGALHFASDSRQLEAGGCCQRCGCCNEREQLLCYVSRRAHTTMCEALQLQDFPSIMETRSTRDSSSNAFAVLPSEEKV